MWGLTLDLEKTYAWATTTEGRKQLAQLNVKVVEDFGELGGALSFTAAHRVRIYAKRGETLLERWQQLRRSKAPLSQKMRVLPIVFWAKAMHGTLSCLSSDSHVHKLKHTGRQTSRPSIGRSKSVFAALTGHTGNC